MAQEMIHVQSTASDTWSITHSLNTLYPTTDVMIYVDGDLQKVLPKAVKCIDANHIVIEFSTQHSGKVRIF
jgi:hypothetical protein